ncbi:MAG: glycoside hydrolase family 75 protein [Akkermansia sp.]|nr:glycoside hydrolase family 75 protein [Akkermansia sp.]
MSKTTPRRSRRFFTWFKLGLLLVLGAGAASLYTPYPARLVRELRGPARVVIKKVLVKTDEKPAPPPAAPSPASEQQDAPQPDAEIPFAPWNPESAFAMPVIELPPFPPALPERVEPGKFEHLNTISPGVNLRSNIHFNPGTTAAQDRGKREAYQVNISMDMYMPHAATGDELLHANPQLPKVLAQFPQLMEKARVSQWFHALYLHKQNRVRKNAATISYLLDRHNFYDTDTILEIEAPNSGRKALWIQADMDVVSDGSDGDRLPTMPESIRKSDHYQPSTSYRWKKRTDRVNPLLPGWQERLTKLRKNPKDNKAAIEHAQLVIADLKRYSFLLAQYDPFIVVPLTVKSGKDTGYRPQPGDYAAVIVGDRVFPAIVGDFGPRFKTGEASLRLCKEVNPKSSVYARAVSDLGVSYIIFPGSAEEEKGPIDYNRLNTRIRELLNEMGGLAADAKYVELHDEVPPVK